jgi:hypothetical protein
MGGDRREGGGSGRYAPRAGCRRQTPSSSDRSNAGTDTWGKSSPGSFMRNPGQHPRPPVPVKRAIDAPKRFRGS